jgi:CO/xanthine dehydrogenase FAD-binding subunit
MHPISPCAFSPLSPSSYERPLSLAAALALLPLGFVPIAGGTDYYAARVAKPLRDSLVDLSAVAELKAFEENNAGLKMGAMTTWRDCVRAQPRMPAYCAALAQAAKDVGGWQVQNRATLGGNLCNASPAADGTVALLGLDASLQLASLVNDDIALREISVIDFVLGNRTTALAANELLVSIRLPAHSAKARSVFLKLGHRKYLVISIVMIAALIDFDGNDHVSKVHVAIGSCAKAAIRVKLLEEVLTGLPRKSVMGVLSRNFHLVEKAISPIDDVRGTAVYRVEAARVLVKRAFAQLLDAPFLSTPLLSARS